MLRHLVSDLAPDLTIRVSLVLPNVTRQDIMQALCGDNDLKTSLGQCLGSRPLPADLADLCLCSDDLSHYATPWDVTPDVLEKMSRWWHKLVVSSKRDPLMDFDLYDNLLARFCGPATTVTVPCVTKPRMSLKTLPEAVSTAGEIFAQITLHHHQVELLQDMARHLDSLHALYKLNAADAIADSGPGSSPTTTSSSDETSNVTSASSNSESETPSTVVTTVTTTAARNTSKETESPADSREACSQQRHASHMFTATPVFCPTWYAVHPVTCDGGAFNHGDSDVVLYVPSDAVGRHVTAAVHAGSCAKPGAGAAPDGPRHWQRLHRLVRWWSCGSAHTSGSCSQCGSDCRTTFHLVTTRRRCT
ncbi:hypothetical protein C0Q70_03582 [Pomacea canaliculata]|uniref:Uncharacterized protein n=1 Tax=Pomacea canaliculata TaxID=400727 RepID=A0A2T7PT86_POMCA|nr:hypothetical protein C0Q70_03582 [Pomacea canaliculata]